MNYFSGDDLIFYKDSTSGKIMSGGYSIDSILLKQGISPMTTLPIQRGGQEEDQDNVSSIFENLAIPAGLFKDDFKYANNEITEPIHYSYTTPLQEDLHDKLFKLVEVNKNKSFTYKNKHKISKKLSRKNK